MKKFKSKHFLLGNYLDHFEWLQRDIVSLKKAMVYAISTAVLLDKPPSDKEPWITTLIPREWLKRLRREYLMPQT